MADRKFGFDTLCLHAGQIPDPATGARALPIYQTTSFVFDSADHAASLFNLQTFGNVYSRISNPTVAAFEERDGRAGGRPRRARRRHRHGGADGRAAHAVPSRRPHRLRAHAVRRHLFAVRVTFAQFGIETTFVDPDDPENFARALRPTPRRVYAETIGNPQLNVLDIAAVAAIAHDAGVPLVIDNTLASPYLCRPIEHGADIVVHSRHQVPRRPRHDDGRRGRRVGQVSLGQRQVSADDRAVARLSRRASSTRRSATSASP